MSLHIGTAAPGMKVHGPQYSWQTLHLNDSTSDSDGEPGDGTWWTPGDFAALTAGSQLESTRSTCAGALFTLVADPQSFNHVQGTVPPQLLGPFADYAETGPPADTSAVSVTFLPIDSSLGEDEFGLQMFVYDVGVVGEQLSLLVASGAFKSLEDLIDFCLRNLIRFSTGVMHMRTHVVDNPADTAVDPTWWIDPEQPTTSVFEQWFRAVALLLKSRPRVYRAALARGGLLARIARSVQMTGMFTVLPTTATICTGCPCPIVQNDLAYQVDWLDAGETQVLLGTTGSAEAHGRSLWPSLSIFDALYEGVWTHDYEKWFKHRLHALKAKSRDGTTACGLCPHSNWGTLVLDPAAGL